MRVLVLSLCLLGASCGPAVESSEASDAEPVVAAAPDGWDAFGAGVAADASATSLASIVADRNAHVGQPVVFEATVDDVCAVKGCWMTLAAGDETVRVKFKDYGFFVPKDIGGRTVRVEGVFDVREVPVDEARHYLEDAGKTEEAAALTEPQQALEVTATGVLVRAD